MIKKYIKEKLPQEYQEVEYLENNDKSHIILNDINFTDSTTVNIKIERLSKVGNYDTFYGNHLGELYVNFNNRFTAYSNITFITPLNDSICNFNQIYDVVAKYTSSGSTQPTLFAYQDPQKIAYWFLGKIYYCKIYENDNYIYDLVPCYRKVDNKPGMYDLVSGQFFTNQGTGEFLVGADVLPIKKISSIKKIINNELKDIKRMYKGNKLMFSNILPKEYQEVEYLEGNGTQKLISNTIPSGYFKMVVDAQFLGGSNFGFGINSSTRFHIGVWESYKKYHFGCGSSSNWINVGSVDNLRHLFSLDTNGVCTVDDNIFQIPNVVSVTYTQYLNIFGQAPNNAGSGRIYNMKLYKDNILINDYIPCYRKADNVAGMYDLVSGEFFINKGTGEFIIGENV